MKKVFKWIGIVFVALIVIGIIATPKKKDGVAAETKIEPTIVVTSAGELARAYHDNTVAADQKFKGKTLQISGTIDSIGTSIGGSPYITLRGGVNQFMEPQLSFERAELDALAKVKVGQKVTAICLGTGDMAKKPMADDCTIKR